MGDFNIHFETLNDHNSRTMHDISEIFSLSQSVTEPTHKHSHLLDLVFHRHNRSRLRSTCLDHGLTSDHIAVLCQLDIPKPAVQPVTTQFRSIRKIDKTPLNKSLPSHHSHPSLISTDSSPSLTNTPLSATAQSVSGSRPPGSAALPSSFAN